MTAATAYWKERAESAESEVDRCREEILELKWQLKQLQQELARKVGESVLPNRGMGLLGEGDC